MPKDKPEIRFAGYTDAWEKRKLGELAIIQGGGTPSSINLDYWNGNINWFTPTEVSNTGYVKESARKITNLGLKKSSAKLLPKGTVLMTSRAGVGDMGILTVPAATNQGFQSMIPNEEMPSYFLYSMQSFISKEANRLASGSTFSEISGKQVSKIVINVPSEKGEKVQIGKLFEQLNNLITVNQRKVDLLKELKKGFLQKMFPKNGEDKPEVRFGGYTDAWEKRKLKDMAKYKNGKGHEDKQSETGMLELVNLNSIGIEGGFKHSGKYVDSADDTLLKNDLVMILSDVGHGNLLGRVALIPESNKFVLNQRVALLRPNKTGNSQFLFSYINAHQRYFKSQGAGMSQLNISKSSVENFNDFVPLVEEQKKIGTFLHNLDQLITVNQRRVDLLKQEKKALLQKMFV
ncbi:restriction endonuclease subunit S [Weissella paramesenteroides]|uniref:Restriction endonuclease subunit S n=1 Tax=Weissella paramesenteroides TaxID=1249 RepID=A0ABD4XHC4_WEIPA|nr:restriction endonuclease subunit S [Weissella paramesenteroides]MDF8368593.1 restriction endonuclease subunit S [Weissella paramesenteroides]MDF8370635.1 restriction endonuclease subunit S [Weissella paramesenteroides]